MLNILVPKDHFLALDYPYMEEYILGLPIPIAWGDVHDIVPFLIDTDYLIYKIVGHAIADITEIRSKGVALGAGSYIEDLPNGEFELAGTPWLAASTTYYFAIEGDYAINGTDFIRFRLSSGPAGFDSYNIDGGGNWNIQTHDIVFALYGKTTLDGEESLMVLTGHFALGARALRDVAARTRLGQRFVTGATSFYATKIRFVIQDFTGMPTGNLQVTFYSSIAPEVQQGIESNWIPFSTDSVPAYIEVPFPQYGEDNDLQVDIESPYPMLTLAADVLESLFVDRLGKDPSILDAAYLAAFAAARDQELKVFIDREITVGDFIGKLEASVLFKFLPLHDGTYATIIFEAGEPAGTPHFRDEDFVEGSEFRIDRDLSVVRQMMRVKYDESPATQEFKIAEARSDSARLFYSNEETIEVETWLKNEIDAEALAEQYSSFFREPQIRITFEVHGFGLNLLPGRDKVKITRARAAWTGGAINGQLFRIMKIVKRPATNSTEITAIYEPSGYGDILYYCHFGLNTIAGVHLDDFMTDETYVPGGYGSGDGQFDNARQVAVDQTYIYVADDLNNRVQKFLSSDGSFIAKTGAGVTIRPWGCAYWNGKLYVSSSLDSVIYILDATTLGLISSFGSYGTGVGEFNGPRSIATDGAFLYICDYWNSRITKHLLSGTPVGAVGSFGTGNGQFNGPTGIATDGTYFFVCDFGNQRIQKFLCSDLSFVSSVPVQTRGGTKGSPESITLNGVNYYVGSTNIAPYWGYIEKYIIATDAFVDFYDPSSIVGIDVQHVWGSFILKEPS